MVGLTEFLGGLLLLAGLLTSVVGVALAIDMIVAIWAYNGSNGFFTETQNGGWELNAIIGLVMLSLALLGPGRWSADAALGLTRAEAKEEPPLAATAVSREPAGVI